MKLTSPQHTAGTMKPVGSQWRCKKMLLTMLVFCLSFIAAKAQIVITNPYPTPADNLTRGLDTSLLTVEASFLSACTGNTATVTLAPGVTYVPGSVTKTSGTASFAIADLGGTANAPTFTISGITGPGTIRFTIKRTAGCGTAASGKDAVSITGSCGTATESDANVNSYNLLSPALALTSPAAVTNAFIGTTASRTITVTNGGNGCLDTLRFSVTYPAGGIVSTNAGSAIIANGVSFTPSSVVGDVLNYKIYGAALFGGDNLLCNGETVTITENIKVVKCNTTTAYNASWGKSQSAICQTGSGTGTVTMATGVAILSATIVENTVFSPCTPGDVTVTFTNNGSGGLAGAMYNVQAQVGNTNPNQPTIVFGLTGTGNTSATVFFSDFKINGNAVTVTQSASTPWQIDMSQFAGTDPDGAGGLSDLDGDGQFDDLAPGSSFVVTMKRNYSPLGECVTPNYYRVIGAKATFNTMCGALTSPLATTGGVTAQSIVNNIIETAPTLVAGGSPFTVRICESGFYSSKFTIPTDSLYVQMDLPAGVTYVPGTAQFNGVTGATVTTVGSRLSISVKRGATNNFCVNADFIYACGVSTTLNIPYKIFHVLERSCNAIEYLACDTITVAAKCTLPCPTGVANTSPSAQRVNFGWTNTSMTTKVDPATLSAFSRKSATVYDTLHIIQPGIQIGNYNNLYYSYELDRAAGADVVKLESGTINYKAGKTGPTITCALPAYNNLSTTNHTKWVWNISPLLGGACGLPATISNGDSIWIDMKLSVTNANNNSLYATTLTAPPNQLSYMYNLDAASTAQYCDIWAPDFYLLGFAVAPTSSLGQFAINLAGCTPGTSNFVNYGFNTGESGDAFPSEYRPGVVIDSMVITYPAGITWTGVTPSMSVYTFNGGSSFSYNAVSQALPAILRGNDLVLKNPGTWIFNDLLPATIVQRHNVVFQIVASCQAAAANNNFTVTSYGKSFVYAGANIPFVSSYTSPGNGSLTATYDATTKPAVTVQNNTGTVQGVLPQHYWDVQVNSTGTVAAPYIWVALEKAATSGIVVDSVVLKPSNTVMTEMTYGTANKWYKVSAAGLASGANQQARVYFKYTNCAADSLLMRSGWNCTGYPTDPASGYACTSSDQYLKVIPENTQVQIEMGRQPGNGGTMALCSQDSATVIVNSAQAANLINPNVVVYPPAGVTFTTPIPVEYPLGSGIWQNLTPVALSGGGYQINLSNHTGIGADGLPGTALNPGANGRQAKLKVQFSTSCATVSGTQLDFVVNGTKPCGGPADGSGLNVKSDPINITGANFTGSAAVSVGLTGSTNLVCGNTRTINASITELSTTTQVGDTAIYTIPAGLNYAGNFTGCASCGITVVPGTGGSTLVKVALPVGLASGTATNFSFDVTVAGTGCNASGLTGRVERNIQGLSCGATVCANSKVILGTSAPVAITVSKPIITITNMSILSGTWQPGTTNTVAVTYRNTGTAPAPATTYIAEFFCGSNTTPFATHILNSALAVNQTATDNVTLNVPAGTCAGGNSITVKVQAVTATNIVQCLCAPSEYVFATVLPVKLASFDAKMVDCKVSLIWKSETEQNFKEYQVAYSKDGNAFTVVGIVPAKGSNNNYSFNHQPQRSKAYYRLQMVDDDGKVTLSKILMLDANCNGAQVITAYPNPTKDKVTIAGLVTNSKIRLMDITGKILTTINTVNTTAEINLQKYPNAIYILQIVQDNKTIQTIKLSKE